MHAVNMREDLLDELERQEREREGETEEGNGSVQ